MPNPPRVTLELIAECGTALHTSSEARDEFHKLILSYAASQAEVAGKDDGAPSRGELLNIIRNAYGPKSGHGACERAAKGEKVCQVCCAVQELKSIAASWRGHMVTLAGGKS